LVERFFNRIKQGRRVATGYGRLAANDLESARLAEALASGRRFSCLETPPQCLVHGFDQRLAEGSERKPFR